VKGHSHSFRARASASILPKAASALGLLCALVITLLMPCASYSQDTGYISGTVIDKSGAAVAGANVVLNNTAGSITRSTTTNSDGAYVIAGVPGDTYNLTVTAKGFQKYTAQKIKLDVAEKARLDVALTVGTMSEEIIVTGEDVAQVETQSSDLSNTITGTQVNQLMLNGRNFTQLATLAPGVTNQTGQDEGTVGVYGNADFSVNGGRTEYNNWEVDGGDNMDNGSNHTLNVYPSIDAIAEVKVLTSNYGAQYGRSGSGTVEVETRAGTNRFHGDVYYFGRNDFFNARNFFDPATDPNTGKPVGAPKFKKHDFGYTIGGPVFIPGHYNTNKEKTFFFFSQEWRRDLVPGQVFLSAVPSLAERGQAPNSTPGFGDFSDICAAGSGFTSDCPSVPDVTHVAIDPSAQALLAMIPQPNAPGAACGGIACFNASPSQPTHWREELVRLDHNFTANERLTFRYIHDSWDTVTPTTLWGGDSFPTIQTNFVGPGTGAVARLTSTLNPTLLNEFVASYTADHIFLTNSGPGVIARPSGLPGLFPNFGGKAPDIVLTGGGAYGGGFSEGQAYIPWNNANPTYTLRDNVTKLVGKHNLQFGAYAAIARKNEQSSYGSTQGVLTFDSSNLASAGGVGTGNAFADMLLGNIASFQQVNLAPKYYFRYQIVEPYLQDDWRVTPRLTLNLGLRLSLFGTYREKYKQAFDLEPSAYNPANAPAIGPDGSLIDPTTNTQLSINDPRVFNGMVQCGASGVPSGCIKGHLFNPAPRIGFAWDPWSNGKTSVRGGYGIFYEHGNGNEQNVEALEATPPLVLNPSQPNITGYGNIGGGGTTVEAFPLGFNVAATKAGWPYVQQWNLSVQQELPQHIVTSIAYVGSKGTHLGLRRDLNQIVPLPSSENPFGPGQTLNNTGACGQQWTAGQTVPGTNMPLTANAANHLNVACGGIASPFRPFVGFSSLNEAVFTANSSYNGLQFVARRSIAPLTLSFAYTYSHSIDDSSDGGVGNVSSLVDSYDFSRARASSDFDQRHTVNISYVYDLPFLSKSTGLAHDLLGGWQFSGITTIQTGIPFSVKDSSVSNNAGVSNGSVNNGSGFGVAVFADLVGDPHATPSASCAAADVGSGPLLFNPCAFADPRGLTFGNVGRNFLHMPRRTNFDMSLLKHFQIKEAARVEFRAEAFNIFNHTQWAGSSIGGANINNDLAGSGFLHPSAAHRARTLQFGLKFLF